MNNSASASKRPRQSLRLGMASGLPTPGARRKSGIPAASPGASPTKRAPRNGHGSSSSAQNDDIANKMAELQAAIRKRDPASYGRPESRSSLHGQSEGDDDEMEEILADGDGEGGAEASSASTSTQLASPRRRTATARPSMTAPRRTSQGSLSSPGPAGSAGGLPGFAYQQRPATLPTTPSSATASGSYLHTRPPSSLSSSSYMSAHTHASTSGATPASRARSPAPGGFATPGRRQSEVMAGTGFLSHTASSMARSTSAASSADGPPSGLHVGDRVSALGMEGTLRYIGDVQFKPGVWGGIELSGEYAGKGKNNGTVQGVQYFACAENGGIFVQASKIDPSMPPPALPAPSTVGRARPPSALGASTASSIGGPTPRKILPRPSGAFIAPSTVARQATKASTEASQVAASRITAGSRASSYLNLTAKDLRAMRSATGESEAARKRSASPEKAGNLSASTASNVSAASTTTGVTPRPVRMGRPSVGGGVSTVLAGTRKSFGGPGTPTPASAIRRPPSAMRTHTPDIPSVPPLPVNLANPGTERQIASTGAPGTPSAARRYSAISRPSTPSARPSSRLSSVAGARSVSRASSRASMVSGASSRLGHRGGDDMLGASTADTSSSGPAVADLSKELQASREALARAIREAEQAKLELLEMTSDLRDEKKRSRQLHNEVAELKRNAAASRLDEASAIDEREADRERHGIELEKLLNQLEEVKEQLAREQASKSEGEADAVQRLLEADKAINERQAALKDREAIAEELANLQAGGRQAIEIYQEKVDILENQLFEEQNALSEAREELFEAKSRLSQHLKQAATQARNASNGLDPNSAEALLAASLGAGRQLEEQGESAVAIENDNLRAELEHMKSRMHRVEEELDDARALLENEQEKDKRKRQESGEVADRLRKEVKDQKERADSAWAERDKVAQRAEELEAALKDNERTLESERAELEVLRKEGNDRPGTPSSAQEELRRAQKALSTLEQDKKAALAESSRLRSQLYDLQEELKLMEEVREDGASGMPSPARLQAREQLESKDRRIHELEQQLQGRPSAVASVPTNTDREGSPDALHNPNGESSSGATTSLHASDALVQLQQAREERDKLEKVNQRLVEEAIKMRDAQRALEQTVNNLMEQMDGFGSSQKLGLSAPVPQRSLSQDTLEAEVTDLRKQLEKAQRVHEKERTNLHSEVSQLESLVEAKIFREDELEQQLDDAKRALGEAKAKLAQASANANAAGTTARDAKATLKAAPPGASNGRRSASLHSDTDDEDGSCELCGDPHGIENCPIFAGSAVSPELQQKPIAAPARQPAGPFCDDCEEYGHDLENCPMANEVF